MKAAIVHDFQSPPRYGDFPDPTPAAGLASVKIIAAGLHQIVRALAAGTHYGSTGALPFVPGVDGVGRLDDGTRVYFGGVRPPCGTFAERAYAPRQFVIPLPDGIDDATAAGIANPAMSSWAALKIRAGFTAGESVVILGATGAAGHLAVQIAKRFGASRIVAVGRDAESLHELQSLGADRTISLLQPKDSLVAGLRDEIAAGTDVVLDYLWGTPAESLLKAIAHKGLAHAAHRLRYIQIGSSAGEAITLPAATLRSSGIELLGSGFGSASMDELLRSVREFFDTAAKQPFQFRFETADLRDIETAWTRRDVRLVFRI